MTPMRCRKRGFVPFLQIESVEQNSALGRPVEPGQQFDQRGLAGAVLADQRQAFTGPHVQIDPRQRRRRRIGVDELDAFEADPVAGPRTDARGCRSLPPTGCSRYSNRFERYRLSSYRPLIAVSAALTADCPCRSSMRYMVICPTVMAPNTVSAAIQT